MATIHYAGPSDTLEAAGQTYRQGDRVKLSAEQIGQLARVGERFTYAHDEPPAEPEPAAAEPPAEPEPGATEPPAEPAPAG